MNTEDVPTIDSLDPIAGASFDPKIERQDEAGPGEEGTSRSDAASRNYDPAPESPEGIRTFRCETRDRKDFGTSQGKQEALLSGKDDREKRYWRKRAGTGHARGSRKSDVILEPPGQRV